MKVPALQALLEIGRRYFASGQPDKDGSPVPEPFLVGALDQIQRRLVQPRHVPMGVLGHERGCPMELFHDPFWSPQGNERLMAVTTAFDALVLAARDASHEIQDGTPECIDPFAVAVPEVWQMVGSGRDDDAHMIRLIILVQLTEALAILQKRSAMDANGICVTPIAAFAASWTGFPGSGHGSIVPPVTSWSRNRAMCHVAHHAQTSVNRSRRTLGESQRTSTAVR